PNPCSPRRAESPPASSGSAAAAARTRWPTDSAAACSSGSAPAAPGAVTARSDPSSLLTCEALVVFVLVGRKRFRGPAARIVAVDARETGALHGFRPAVVEALHA